MKKLFLIITAVLILTFIFSLCVFASDTVPGSYIEDEYSYTVYTAEQYDTVTTGIRDGILTNKTVVLGSDINCKTDLVMNTACDITIDLNGKFLNNKHCVNKSGDFDMQNENAVIRIRNGRMYSSFCMFIFRNAGQIYLENVEMVSNEECFYQYGGHSGVLSLKNCSVDVVGNYSAIYLGNCGNRGGMLYEIDGCMLDGLCIHCARPGSYIKDTTVYDRRLHVDCWQAHGENGSDVTVIFTNVSAMAGTVELNDGRINPEFYDCQLGGVHLTGTDKYLVVYTTVTCEKAGTKLEYKGSDTPTVDEQYSIDNPKLGHIIDISGASDIQYDSLLDVGYYAGVCQRCGEENKRESSPSAEALFTLLGYSSSENGAGGITVGFLSNISAVGEYETVTGKTVKYGIFIAAKNLIGDNSIFSDNGALTKGVINAEVINRGISVFELKVSGFKENQRDIKLAMGAYASISDGEITEYSYMQNDAPDENEKYSFISYNDIVNSASREN